MLAILIMSVLIPTVPSGQVLGPRIVRSMFNTDPASLQPGDAESLHAAGVSHLAFQLFHSPCYSGITKVADFERDFELNEYSKIQWCIDRKFRVTGMLDESLRIVNGDTKAMDWLHHSPIALECLGYVARRCRESGVVDSVRVVDESQPPAIYAPVQPFIDTWRANGGPPLSWPNIAPEAWETPALSDQSARYWTAWSGGDFPFSRQAALISQATTRLRLDRPWSCLAWCCGPQYQVKGASKFRFNSGVKASDIVGQVWRILADGASEIDLYGFDWSLWQNQRANGNGLIQTGSRPGDDRWAGVCQAFQTVAKYERSLLRTPYKPTRHGPWLFGRRGEAPDSLVWGINTSDFPQPHPHGAGNVASGGVVFWDLLQLIRPGSK